MHGLEDKLALKEQFISLLQNLKIEELSISQYNKIYLAKHLDSAEYAVNLGWQILETGLKYLDKPLSLLSVAEIGGGTGVISLLAAWLGFEKVTYSDTYKQSCDDFEVLSNKLGLKIHQIICGSIHELATQKHGFLDLIVSRDVVEHIYNPSEFLKHSSEKFRQTVMVHNTSANIHNIFKKQYFISIHEKDEWQGNVEQFKPGDSVESFYQMRFNFITKQFPDLSQSRVEILAALTRGKIYSDISKLVNEYLFSNKLPTLPEHQTNTCDPENGNWTEHLIPIKTYESFIDSLFFSVKWQFAFYDVWRNKGSKRLVQKILNWLIKHSGKTAKFIAPAIILVIVPKNS